MIAFGLDEVRKHVSIVGFVSCFRSFLRRFFLFCSNFFLRRDFVHQRGARWSQKGKERDSTKSGTCSQSRTQDDDHAN